MRKLCTLTSCFLLLFSFVGHSNENIETTNRACATDVQIAEGNTLSFCQGTFTTINASAGFVSYAWTGPQTGATPALAPTASGMYTVTAVDGVGCISSDSILVTINPNPVGVISSSEGSLICPGGTGTILSLSQVYSSYLWGGGSAASTLLVNQGGTYTVHVVDFNGCAGNSAITITEPPFALNPIGTTTVCNGSTATLLASGGTSYVWSTGEVGSTIVVSPLVTTDYSVLITSGICSQTLTQTITTVEIPDSQIEDTFFIAEGDVQFINGPDFYTSYSWTPTTDLSIYTNQGATFSGSSSTAYNVNSINTNGCMRSDSIWIIIVRLTIPTGFSPNADGINDAFVIPELATYKGSITLFNRWGDKVYENSDYQNDWEGTCNTSFCLGQGQLPEGTYFYSLDIEKVHFDGYTTLKR